MAEPIFIKFKGSLCGSQEIITNTCPEANESSSQLPAIFLYEQF
jgi:hypothetical protein